MNDRPRPTALRRLVVLAAVAAVVLAACGSAAGPTPSPSPAPSGGPPLTAAQLRYAIVDRFGPLWYCDRDLYPLPREEEQALAIRRFAEVRADAEAFGLILDHLGLTAGEAFTDAQKLAIYRAWKVLAAIALEPADGGRFRFDYLAQPAAGAAEGTRTAGFIDATGAIEIVAQAAAGEPICPICLARGTAIETPVGPIPVERLRLGDPIWTLDATARRVGGTVIAIGSTPAPRGHEVIRLVLVDGRSLAASPGHPLADGRRLGDLRPGDLVGGAAVATVDRIPYGGVETFDVLASGATGAYLVAGIGLGSTLRP
jgi:hypothetical protein